MEVPSVTPNSKLVVTGIKNGGQRLEITLPVVGRSVVGDFRHGG